MPVDKIQKKVLVTGGGGFIGSRLVHTLLERGCKVKVLDIQFGRLKRETNPNLEFIGIGNDYQQGGMVNRSIVEQAIKNVDVIYHLSINWNGHTWRHRLPLADLFDANIRGTLNLIETARSQEVRHFLFTSSCAVYGKVKSRVTDEETVCQPELWEGDPGPAYGILKLTTEKLCLMYHHHYRLPVTAFRIEAVFDDSEPLFLRSKIVDKVMNGETIEVLEGEGFVTIYVNEVVQALLMATLNKNTYGEVFNLSNPAPFMSYRELCQFLIEITGSKSEVKVIPNPLQISSVLESIEKVQRILDWKPQKTKEDVKKVTDKYIHSLLKKFQN